MGQFSTYPDNYVVEDVRLFYWTSTIYQLVCGLFALIMQLHFIINISNFPYSFLSLLLCLSIVSIQNVNKDQKNGIRVFEIVNSARMGLNRRSSLWSSTAFLNCLEFSDRYRCMINSQHNSRKLWKTTKGIWSSISLLIEIDEKLAYNSQIISSSSH